jgi:hypothetical protein
LQIKRDKLQNTKNNCILDNVIMHGFKIKQTKI